MHNCVHLAQQLYHIEGLCPPGHFVTALVRRTVILSCIKAGNTEWVILSQNIILHYVPPKQTAECSERI